MVDDKYSSTGGTGQQDREQHCQQKCLHGHETHTISCSQKIDQSTAEAYSAGSQMIDPAVFWFDDEAEKMDWELVASESLGSLPIALTNIGTPSSFAEGVSSGDMINTWSFSNGSNQISGEGSEQVSYPRPRRAADGWMLGSEYAFYVAAMAEDYLNSVRRGQRLFLPDLCSPEPEPFGDPYQQDIANYTGYQEQMKHYKIHSSRQASISESSYRPLKPYKGSYHPWTHCDPRVPRFDPGFVAFGLSPEPVDEKCPQDSSSGNSMRSKSPRSCKSKTIRKKSYSSRTTSESKGEDNPTSPGWEHIVIGKGGLNIVCLNIEKEGRSGSGRKGKLDREAAEKAARVRRLKACWRCWVLKVPCSEGEPCERCKKNFSKCSLHEISPSSDQLCSRSGFKDYDAAFFPEYLHSHFKRRSIEDLVSEHSNGFRNTSLEIDVNTGSSFESMRLLVNIFRPTGWGSELLVQHHMTTEVEEPSSRIVCRYSAPVGLLALSLSEMKIICRDHIVAMIENPMYVEQTTAGDGTQITRQILETVWQYHNSKPNEDLPLVHNAMMLHAIHYFMSHRITFTDESAKKVTSNVLPFVEHIPLEPFKSSRLLTRQIKYAMHKIHREITQEVLDGLEKSMRTRTRDSWGPSFCSIFILCLCIEILQVAADTFVIGDIQKSAAEGLISQYTRSLSSQASQVLDDYPYRQCTKLFHDIYKSHKESNGSAREGGFNPLRKFGEMDVQNSFLDDKPTEVMVRAIYCIIYSSYDELLELAQRPTLTDFGCSVEPKDIMTNNTGRLVAKFLLSFFSKA